MSNHPRALAHVVLLLCPSPGLHLDGSEHLGPSLVIRCLQQGGHGRAELCHKGAQAVLCCAEVWEGRSPSWAVTLSAVIQCCQALPERLVLQTRCLPPALAVLRASPAVLLPIVSIPAQQTEEKAVQGISSLQEPGVSINSSP